MRFEPLRVAKQKALRTALEKNAEDNAYLMFDKKDTSFAGISNTVSDEEVTNSIRSIPCHYSPGADVAVNRIGQWLFPKMRL